MNQYSQSLGICVDLESDYIPFVSFKSQHHKDIAEKYITLKADILLNKILNLNIDTVKSQISSLNLITDKDFKSKRTKYFYENIFADLGQRDSNNQLIFSPKWGITFDEKCAPISVSYLSPKFIPKYQSPTFSPFEYRYIDYEWIYKYGTIDINEKPVFYYIYFTLQEILDEIKKI